MTRIPDFSPAFGRSLAAGVALALLAGCAAPTAYGPRLEGKTAGYTDRELTHNRYRVTFTGNSVTPRETVENYLLLRAAEVSLAAGSDQFVFDTRNTKARTTYTAIPDGPDPYGPGWGWRHRGFGWGGFGAGGWGGYGFAYDPAVDIVTRTNYEAYAEIVLLTPDQARSETRAINAREVVSHLGPEAVPPDRKPPV